MITRDDVGQAMGDGGGGVGGGEFDVFLSHNGRDKPVVERIAEQLRREGVRPFLDVWALTPGGRWQRDLSDALSRSKTCALFVGPNAFGQWQLEELELALVHANQRQNFRVFPVLLPGVEDPFDAQRLPPFLSTRTWVDLRDGTDGRQALQRLLNAIAGVAPGPSTPVQPVAGIVPYRGLEPFEEQHAELFFGRERDIQRLLEILKASRLLCVVGPSGCGKSSLVRAGLIPRLRHGALPGVEDCKVCVLRPGAHPLLALATQLAPLGTGTAMQATLDDLASDRRTLHLAVSLALGADAPRSRVVIVVDQLEEVFTLCRDEHEREQFFANLLHAASASTGQTVVVLTMRADFYGRCAPYPELAQETAHALALIGPMDPDELRHAIEQPARKVGLFFEPGLVDTILDDLGTDSSALPLLEHALLEVWKRRVGDQLTLDGYVQAGRVEGALAQRAERVYSSFTPHQQQLARRLLLRLTQPGEGSEDTRRRASLDELRPSQPDDIDSFNKVLGRLVNARLLTTGRDETDDQVVDVSHEALIRGWPRLRDWIDADRAGLLTHRRLTDAAIEWDTLKREPTTLYRGTRLATANEWATDHDEDLSRLEREFLAASTTAEQHDFQATRRRTRRLRALAAILAALVVVAGTSAVLALRAADRADSERKLALSRSLATQALATVDQDLDQAALLAAESYRLKPTIEARNAVRTLLLELEPAAGALKGHTDSVLNVAFSPDGRTLATTSGRLGEPPRARVRLWDVRRRRPLGKPLTGHTGLVMGVAFSPDGRILATTSVDKTVRLWDVRRRRPLGGPLKGHSDPVFGVAFSPDGQTLATASGSVESGAAHASVRLWDVRRHRALGGPLKGHTDLVADVAFSPDGRTLASISTDETMRVWDVRTRRPRGKPLKTATINMALSSDGRTLATAGRDKKVRLWDVQTRRPRGKPLKTGTVDDIGLSPDGRTLITHVLDLGASAARPRLRLWDVRRGRPLGPPLKGHTDTVNGAAFSPDGRTLATASDDKSARLWDIRRRRSFVQPLTNAGSVSIVALSADAQMVATTPLDFGVRKGPPRSVRLWDARRGLPLGKPLKGHTASVNEGAFSDDGRTLATTSNDETVRLWDVRRRRPLGRPLKIAAATVAFSPDGRTLATASGNTSLRLWDVRTRRPLDRPLKGPRGPTHSIWGVAFSPDGRTLATTSDDGSVQFWDVRRRRPLGRPLKGHTDSVNDVAFSLDGHTLATASQDRTVRLWDVRHRRPLGGPMKGHTDSVNDVAFSPDGRTLASSGNDVNVRLWDIPTRRPLGQLGKRYSADLAFSPDAGTLIVARYDDEVVGWNPILWSNNWSALRDAVCTSVRRSLSVTDWRDLIPGEPYHQTCPTR